ncbi:MAG: PA2169 family four-helix-bundle protein [Phenylobacterium sp.]|uniref:PA2169 family four-helix-bundle protein n=1 Tax=Phenylobacterium sp. TaxID=1871053 RepID=UPI0027329583|nr:PA2169 family four-helix-bundle protein [Phenylobacterium sp.]MDP3173546.1 PA2169 family four-helix-bundle protein [Phenylobacterium sp.]
MDTVNDHAVKVLNSLIETTLDSASGYREAAEHAQSSQFGAMFAQRAASRAELVGQLQQEVRSFGGSPETDQSLLGKAHNKFVELKNAIMGGDDRAVINEVERGENFIKAKYEAVIDDQDLPANARNVVQRAYASIKADHDEISRLKAQLN